MQKFIPPKKAVLFLEKAAGQEVGSVDKMLEVRISSRCMETNGFS